MGRSITPENRPAGITGMGTAPPPLVDNALRKRTEKCMGVCTESATGLDCKWDQGVPPPMDFGSGPILGRVRVKHPILHQLGRIP